MAAVGEGTGPRLSRRTVRNLDIGLVIWTLAWIGMGVWIDREIESLTILSDTVVRSGHAIGDTAAGFRSLEDVPFVGSRIGELAREVQAQADLAIENAQLSRSNISRIGVLIGVSVALIPSLPLLGLYLLLIRPRPARAGPGEGDGRDEAERSS